MRAKPEQDEEEEESVPPYKVITNDESLQNLRELILKQLKNTDIAFNYTPAGQSSIKKIDGNGYFNEEPTDAYKIANRALEDSKRLKHHEKKILKTMTIHRFFVDLFHPFRLKKND
jgi:DNA-directed RNA polymerase specialized sigma54-like protein